MSHSPHRRDPGLGWMLACSAAIHLALYFFLLTFNFSPRLFTDAPVYYVDVVNLPVANPQAGAPSPPGGVPSVPVPAPARQEMTLPAKASRKTGQKPAKLPTPRPAKPAEQKPAAPGETAEQFEERVARLERQVESQHQSAAMDALRKKLAGAGKGEQAGMPGGKGTEKGSDYGSYIRSRLTDAFRSTIAYQTKNPEVVVRLTIDRTGKLAGQRMERSSKDRMFEEAVFKAIAIAEKSFPPPPAGEGQEYSIRFTPEGVRNK
jgi:colicin import membrane protein